MKVVCVINKLVGAPSVRAELAFICAARIRPPPLLIDVAQRRRLRGCALDTIVSNKKVWPQPAPPGCGLSTSATPNAIGAVSPEYVFGSAGPARLFAVIVS